MFNIGFDSLWSGVSNTLGYGAAEISELTGSADKKRAQELALKQLSAQSEIIASQQKTKMLIVIGVFLFLIIGLAISRNK